MARDERAEDNNEQVAQEFFGAISHDFLKDCLRVLRNDYRGGFESCMSDFAAPEAHDLYPHFRRAMIEGHIKELAKSHGMQASSERNSKRSSFYTLIASDNIRLTVKSASHPDVKVEDATYRRTYAKAAQLKLWGEQPPIETTLYAILLHGPNSFNRAKPGFAHIVFPDESFTEYVERIDLKDMFPDLARELFGSEEEVIHDDLDIRLREEIAEDDYFDEPQEEDITDTLDLRINEDAEEQGDEEKEAGDNA